MSRVSGFLAFTCVVAVTLVLHLPAAQACTYEFSPAKPSGVSGHEISVRVGVVWTHRKCELKEDQVGIEARGAEIVSKTPWTKTDDGHYTSTVKLRLGPPGEGTLRVFRTCSREGTTERLTTITIYPAG